jgi:hypothetical protein
MVQHLSAQGKKWANMINVAELSASSVMDKHKRTACPTTWIETTGEKTIILGVLKDCPQDPVAFTTLRK